MRLSHMILHTMASVCWLDCLRVTIIYSHYYFDWHGKVFRCKRTALLLRLDQFTENLVVWFHCQPIEEQKVFLFCLQVNQHVITSLSIFECNWYPSLSFGRRMSSITSTRNYLFTFLLNLFRLLFSLSPHFIAIMLLYTGYIWISFYFIVVIIVYLYYYHCIFLLLFSLLLLFITYFRVIFCYNDFVAISQLQLLYPYCYPCYNGNNIVVINFFSVLFLIGSFYVFYLSSISFNLYSFLKDFCQFAILKKAAKPQTKWLLISKKPNGRLFECKFASHINCCSYILIEFV